MNSSYIFRPSTLDSEPFGRSERPIFGVAHCQQSRILPLPHLAKSNAARALANPNRRFILNSIHFIKRSLFHLLRAVGIGILEWCWNVYPSTIYSSAVLHLVHLVLLVLIVRNEPHFSRLFGSLKSRRSSFDIVQMEEEEKSVPLLSTRTPSKSRYRLRSSGVKGN